VEEVHSSYFADEKRFPPGSVSFDCALAMRNLEHEWHLGSNTERVVRHAPCPVLVV
jgi:hypothetical protein